MELPINNMEDEIMYKIAVPITNRYPNREMDEAATLAELKKAGAQRVWLCACRGIEAEAVLADDLRLLRQHRLFFEANGLEVGAWISSLGHGGPLTQDDAGTPLNGKAYQKIVGLTGETGCDGLCPSDETFARDYADWIGRIAQTGIKLIMIDDDYRLSTRPCGNGCCCDLHMAEYRRRVGENIERKDMFPLIMRGRANKYRDAWLDMGRDALLGLARKIRARVDEVDPTVRVGVCAVMGTWDVDGVTALEITKTLAGSTRPFLRTIGAPYWAAMTMNQRLEVIIGYTRLQRHWCEQENVELFTEGDAYPRPRYRTPAAYLEMYDMALRADGGFDGILKYMMDYTASPRYERGYIDRMARNKPAYDWIEAHLSGGTAEGADIICRHDRLRNADLPEGLTQGEINDLFFYSMAESLAAETGLPFTFGTRNAHIVCGEDARTLDMALLDDGMALDATAARLLSERGVDVGLHAMGAAEKRGGVEHYIAEDEYNSDVSAKRFYPVTLDEKAEVLSTLGDSPAAYRYENAHGQRFIVYCFDFTTPYPENALVRSYCRQRQLIDGLEWAGRRKLPAVCPGQPDLYMTCKRTKDGLAVGLWNLSVDVISDARIRLDGAYTALEAFNAAGAIEGDGVLLSSDIMPFSFVGFTVRNTKN